MRMRHIYMQGIIGLIWLVAAIVCGIPGNFPMMGLYIVLAGALLYFEYAVLKKEKGRQRGRVRWEKRFGLLLLDEPANGLDFQSTEYLDRQISGDREYGTALFSSHILESITLTSGRVFVLKDGRIRQTFERGQIHAEDIREVQHDENDR